MPFMENIEKSKTTVIICWKPSECVEIQSLLKKGYILIDVLIQLILTRYPHDTPRLLFKKAIQIW